jgi:hypothetical protein
LVSIWQMFSNKGSDRSPCSEPCSIISKNYVATPFTPMLSNLQNRDESGSSTEL